MAASPDVALTLTKRLPPANQFKPGKSGNPGGRPKSFGQAVRRRCGKDGHKLVQGFYVLAFGTPKQRKTFFGEDVEVSARDRREAMAELANRGFGRPATIDTETPQIDAPQIIFNVPLNTSEREGVVTVRGAVEVIQGGR